MGIELHPHLSRQTPSSMTARSSRQLPPTDHTDLRMRLSRSPGKGHQSSPNPSPSLNHTGKRLITPRGRRLLLPQSPEKSRRLQLRNREEFRHLLKQICPECELAVLILPMILLQRVVSKWEKVSPSKILARKPVYVSQLLSPSFSLSLYPGSSP